MALTDVQNKIDNWLAPRWTNLATQQAAYFAARGQFFQGLWTHSVDIEQTDALSGDQLADQLNQSPTDQDEDWRGLIGSAFDAEPFPARLKVDVYAGLGGWGWSATLRVLYQGSVYERSQGVGPQADVYTQAWYLVNEPE